MRKSKNKNISNAWIDADYHDGTPKGWPKVSQYLKDTNLTGFFLIKYGSHRHSSRASKNRYTIITLKQNALTFHFRSSKDKT